MVVVDERMNLGDLLNVAPLIEMIVEMIVEMITEMRLSLSLLTG